MKIVQLFKATGFASIALASISGAIFVVSNGVALQTVTSRSMEPTMRAGDIVVTKQIDTPKLQSQDIVVLPVPENRELRFSHRVIELKRDQQRILIRTKGDANPNPDKWFLHITSEKVPKVFAILPTAHVLAGAIGRKVLFLALSSAGLVLFLLSMYRFVRNRAD